MPGELVFGDVRQKMTGVDINRVTAGLLDDGYPRIEQLLCQVGGLPEAISHVAFIQALAQPGRDGIQICAAEKNL